jgi:protein CpxP
MTARKNLFTALSSLLMVFAVAGASLAQDTVTTTKQADTVQQDGKEGRGFGRHHKGDGEGRGFKGGDHGRRGGRGGKHGFGGPRGGGMREFAQINLTDDQKTQLKNLHESFRTKMDGNEGSRKEMFTLMGQKRDNTLTAEGQARLKEMRDQMKAQHEQLRANALNILTAEQKTQLETIKAERKLKMEQRRKEWQERKAARAANAPAEKTNN